MFLELVLRTQKIILLLRRFQSYRACTVEFILRYEASTAVLVRPYTVVRPYRVFESRLWADCSLTADVSARTRTRTVRLYSRTAEQLRRRLVSFKIQLYCGFGKFWLMCMPPCIQLLLDL
jgi:hypothetical protein